jgi:3-oxoacyl-[acyl-carrier-protein] synthase-3
MTFDISQGCAGYTHGLTVATALMDRLGLTQALLFSCDPYSGIVNPDDRNTSLIFGDAATATLLKRGNNGFALVDTTYGTMPASSGCLTCESELRMDGQSVLRYALREIPPSIEQLLSKHHLDRSSIDLFLLHPGSRYIRNLLTQALAVDDACVPFTIEDYGNTVSSSLPIMLQPHLGGGSRKRIVMSGFGVGFSWASCLLDSRSEENADGVGEGY